MEQPVGIAATIARKEWEELCRRRDWIFEKWDEALENPTPEGYKRCMNCYEAMPWDENCECLIETGKDIRRKALLAWGPGSENPPANPGTRKKKKNHDGRQSSLLF